MKPGTAMAVFEKVSAAFDLISETAGCRLLLIDEVPTALRNENSDPKLSSPKQKREADPRE